MVAPFLHDAAVTSNGFSSSRPLVMPEFYPGMALIAWTAGEAAVSSDTMTGWTRFFTANGGSNEHLAGFRKVADGGDSGTVTGGGLANRFGLVIAIGGWDGVLANIGSATAATGSLNPNSLNMGAARDHLFVAFARGGSGTLTTAPTSYTHVPGSPATGGSSSNVRLAAASRATTNVQTEDPAAFSGSASLGVAGLIGVRPGTSGLIPTGHPGFLQFF